MNFYVQLSDLREHNRRRRSLEIIKFIEQLQFINFFLIKKKKNNFKITYINSSEHGLRNEQ